MPNQGRLRETKHHGAVRFPFNIYPCTIPGDFLQVPLHWHDSMELVYVKKGSGIVQVGVNAYPAEQGDIYIFAPGTLHALHQRGQAVMEYENIIFELELLEQSAPDEFALRVVCSKGTYIRTLCQDLGQALGCGGCMAALRRTRSGNFSVENARRIGELTRADRDTLLPADTLFSAATSLTLTAAQEKRCRCGNPFRTDAPDGETRFYSENGEFLAIGRVVNGEAVTVKSFFEV